MFAKKSLGQNFLMHAQTGERIVAASGVGAGDTVLEVGPGTGMLTRALLKKGARVIAVEADHELVDTLTHTFAQEIGEGRLTLVSGDIRAFDTNTIAGEYSLVANIPYYLTGELLRQFLTSSHPPLSMTVLVQKEVAERIARQKGKTPKESLLSLSVKAYGRPQYCFTVPRGAFIPAPNVDSAVLSIRDISRHAFATPVEEQRFFELLHAGFAHKRKRLAKNLEAVAEPARIASTFAAHDLSPDARAEDLPLALCRRWPGNSPD